ncbi:hypothetical protein PSPO01_14284 [Paraphaeosphaeria sporulosa]
MCMQCPKRAQRETTASCHGKGTGKHEETPMEVGSVGGSKARACSRPGTRLRLFWRGAFRGVGEEKCSLAARLPTQLTLDDHRQSWGRTDRRWAPLEQPLALIATHVRATASQWPATASARHWSSQPASQRRDERLEAWRSAGRANAVPWAGLLARSHHGPRARAQPGTLGARLADSRRARSAEGTRSEPTVCATGGKGDQSGASRPFRGGVQLAGHDAASGVHG